MKFDKSKVCVAGLHEVKEGTKGYCTNTMTRLASEVLTEKESNVCTFCKEHDGHYFVRGKKYNFEGVFFYPAPEKQYRPFETLEEMYSLLGKVIVNKEGSKRCIVASVENNTDTLFINNMGVTYAFNNYVFDETGEPVGVEV